MIQKSPRRVLMERLKEKAQEVRNGTYFARRGVINWASFPFDTYSRAFSISFDETQFLTADGIHPARVTIEVAMKIPELKSELDDLDDEAYDEMYEDLQWVVSSMLNEKISNTDGDPVIFKFDRNSVAIEFSDATYGVQGLTFTFGVDY